MPVAAYSTLLWEQPPGYASGIPVFSNIVPAGFVWVVRSVSAINQFAQASLGINQLIFSVDNYATWATPRNASVMNVPYEAKDVRWVTPAGTFLSIQSISTAWHVRVSGYQLQTAPGP